MSKDFRTLTRELLNKYKVPFSEEEVNCFRNTYRFKTGEENLHIIVYERRALFFVTKGMCFGDVTCEKELHSSIANLSDLF